MDSKLKKKNLENKRGYWWLSSATSYGSDYAGYVYGDGGIVSDYDADIYFGVSPAFLI